MGVSFQHLPAHVAQESKHRALGNTGLRHLGSYCVTKVVEPALQPRAFASREQAAKVNAISIEPIVVPTGADVSFMRGAAGGLPAVCPAGGLWLYVQSTPTPALYYCLLPGSWIMLATWSTSGAGQGGHFVQGTCRAGWNGLTTSHREPGVNGEAGLFRAQC